ncbi:kinase-like protein [Exidia glandulosa HHB12029]|uniref:Kinase-like protein n=1 Tax=Exidia glandulosa HHB12029 TaxID=1314781 RepID=A0A165EDA5_EXIGL|nr:kinase-like protein [Exidia glandulosa HHB12029]
MFDSHNAHMSALQLSEPVSSALSTPSRLTAEDETKSDPTTLVATFSNSANLTNAVHDISTRPVGYGDLSDVYTGIWRNAYGDQKVAIKVLRARPSTSDTDTLSSILLRELSRWQRLQHRNVDLLFGFFDGFGPLPALVSPWYESGNAISYLQRRGGDPDVDAIKIELLLGAMTGLCYLHDQSIVHGGIRGSNVLVSQEGIARLCDVGLTPILSQNSQSFEHSGGIEPDRYRCSAPELSLVEGAQHSYASDVWASGCLFIEVRP